MYPKLHKIIFSHTLRQSLITVVSTFLAAGLGAVYYLILARLLGPHNYGLFSLSTTLLVVLLTIADVGSGQGTVRFVAQHQHTSEYFSYAKLALQVKIYSGVFCILFLTLAAQPLASQIFHQTELAPLIPLVGIAVFCQLLLTYSMSVFQGLQQFLSWGSIQVISNLIRLFFVLILILWLHVNPVTSLWAFCLASLFGFALSWLWLNPKIITSNIQPQHIKKFWQFNRWTAAFMILVSLVSRLDTILTARYLSLSQTGVYSLAVTMVSFLPQMASAVGAVTGSKFASFSDKYSAISYLRKSLLFSTGISLGVGLIMIPTALFVIWLTGKDYYRSFAPFIILLISLILFSATNPFRDAVLYYFHKPQFFVWATLLQGLIIFTIGTVTIPPLGGIGSAITVLSGQLFLGLLSGIYCLKQFKKV